MWGNIRLTVPLMTVYRFDDLILRVAQLATWSSAFVMPYTVWLPGLIRPEGLLTAIKQVTNLHHCTTYHLLNRNVLYRTPYHTVAYSRVSYSPHTYYRTYVAQIAARRTSCPLESLTLETYVTRMYRPTDASVLAVYPGGWATLCCATDTHTLSLTQWCCY